MAHSNLAFFIPHLGCPHRCSFCDQQAISGAHAPTPAEVSETCQQALQTMRAPRETEIAFFGGSFTAIPRPYLCALLEAVQSFLGKNGFAGIRISTRPDCVGKEICQLLRQYGVTVVELGAQSLCDAVLEQNQRGHTAADVTDACARLRQYGFQVGLQLMTGLYGSTPAMDLETMRQAIALRPDCVRIYPTVILQNTRLATLYASGAYQPPALDDMVSLCAQMLEQFSAAGIPVIRCGLHASATMEAAYLGGCYHPAFRELCESRILRERIARQLAGLPSGSYTLRVQPSGISRAVGHGRCNLAYFAAQGMHLHFTGDPTLGRYACELQEAEESHSCT